MLDELWSGLIRFTEQFIVPDWGSLIGLLPVFLSIVVALYLTGMVYRFATAGPTRRGIRKLPPVAPPGIHMPGPSFAPPLAAFGAFMLVFGVITRGVWLWVGLLVLVVTLLYWGREALRDYDRIPAEAGGHAAAGTLPAPAIRQPPAGVHIPPPSFRPLLLAVSMTILVAGMIFGGWALLFGILSFVVVALGWLRDARREYVAVEDADRSGHLDLGGAPAWPVATFATLALIIAGALLLSSGVLPNSHPGTATASGAPQASAGGGTAGGGATPAPSLPAADVTVTAENIAFTETTLTIPAGKPFTLAFDNRDNGIPHDVVIKDASGAELFKGDIVTGPKVVVYNVPAIPAGTYTFVCSVHPNMTGTVTAK
jgi:plastocyanin